MSFSKMGEITGMNLPDKQCIFNEICAYKTSKYAEC